MHVVHWSEAVERRGIAPPGTRPSFAPADQRGNEINRQRDYSTGLIAMKMAPDGVPLTCSVNGAAPNRLATTDRHQAPGSLALG